MGALFSRIKNWASTEDVTNTDLNAEFDNILNNLTAANVDDYSSTAAQMQTVTDPGEVGSESLATNIAEELERVRFVLKEIKGDVAQWYTTGATSLSEVAAALGTSLDGNRVSSGPVYSGSQAALFLIPDGTAASAKIDGTPTNLVYYVNGTAVTISTDLAISSLTAAPSTNNTATVNDTAVADGEETKWLGEYGTEITIDSVGSEITALVGQVAAFKINNGSADEYFLARVKDSTTLSEAKRGYFFDSSSAAVDRVAIADNDTITLLKINWIFGKNDGTITKTTNEPKWQSDTPSSPSTDDYWFDITNSTWKRYDGASFVSADATFLGLVVCDSSNAVGARSVQYAGDAVRYSGIDLVKSSATEIRATHNDGEVGVYDSTVNFRYDAPTWDITADLEDGTEANSTMYYLYLTETGDTKISTRIPRDHQAEYGGYYHPHHLWRCVGQVYNDSSGDLENPTPFQGPKNIFPSYDKKLVSISVGDGTSYTMSNRTEVLLVDAISDDMTITLPSAREVEGNELTIKRTDNPIKPKQDFSDSDVTTGTDNINITSHGYVDLQKVQVSNSGGALPTGLSASTDYWIIYVDADNFKLASSYANSVADSAVDITAAAGGGTHTIEPQHTVVTLSGPSNTMYTAGEVWKYIADGTSWIAIDHRTKTDWSSGGAPRISATTTDPASGTVTHSQATWMRDGANMIVILDYRQSSAGTAGSGKYLYEVPCNATLDTTNLILSTATAEQELATPLGHGQVLVTNSLSTGTWSPHDSTHLYFWGENGTGTGIWDSALRGFNNADLEYNGKLVLPISGWEA